MPVKMKPINQIIQRLGLEERGRVHTFFTATCAKHMDRFVPMDTGTLAETVIVNGQTTSNVKEDTITYDQNYAKVVYYGIRNGKNINYHRDKHPQAGPYWDKRMISVDSKKIEREMNEYINHGGSDE